MSAPRTPAAAVIVAVCVLCAPAGAAAHMGSTKYLAVERTEDGARVIADVEVVDVAYELELAGEDDRTMLAAHGRIAAWIRQRIRVTSRGGACPATVDGEPTLRSRDALRYVSVTLDYACPSPRTGLLLHDDAVFDGDARHEAIVRLASGADVSAHVLRTGSRELALGESTSLPQQAGRFLVEGMLHLFTGYDHVLFLLSLLLVAGEIAARDGMRRAIRNVAVVVTGFTLGHSVTLIAAALDVVTLPSRLVESGIALSIVVVAVWNLVRPEARRGLPWVAAAFGLVHGFGFSSVLRELVLPRAGTIVALLSFNFGIELAQLAIVIVVLGPLAWGATRPWYHRTVVQGGSVAITLVASYWLITRALGL